MQVLSLLLISMVAVGPVWAREAAAQPYAGASFIERLPEGQIDWGSGWVQAQGLEAGGSLTTSAAQAEALKLARHALKDLLRKAAVTSSQTVGALLGDHGAGDAELDNIVRGAQLVDRRCYSDGSVEVWAAVSLRGGFLQLVLPHDVTSIAALRQVNGAEARPGAPYTGLVVDARGLGARPALCPRLLSEDGSEVFGPGFVSRESAVQRGVAAYAAGLPEARVRRTGPRPMVVKGLRATGPGRCDVVISRADANRVRSAPESVEFLQRCNVLIVLD